MKLSFFLIIIIVFTCIKSVNAQNSDVIRDTIYYLADTAKVPVKDRILEIGVELPFKYFAIQCRCLKYNQRPVFACKIDDPSEVVDRKELKKIHLISIINLIGLATDNGGDAFNYKHIAYIFEPRGRKFIKRKVILQRPMRHEVTY